MAKIIESLKEISERYNVLFCDIWGCIHNGKHALPGALKALSNFTLKAIMNIYGHHRFDIWCLAALTEKKYLLHMFKCRCLGPYMMIN